MRRKTHEQRSKTVAVLLCGKVVTADGNHLSGLSYSHKSNWAFTSGQMDKNKFRGDNCSLKKIVLIDHLF